MLGEILIEQHFFSFVFLVKLVLFLEPFLDYDEIGKRNFNS